MNSLMFKLLKEMDVYSIIVVIIVVIGIVVIISKKDTFLTLAWGSMKIILNFADTSIYDLFFFFRTQPSVGARRGSSKSKFL